MRLAFVLLVASCQTGVSDPAPSTTGPAASPPTVPITPLAQVAVDVPGTGEVAPPWTLTASDGSGL